jgi:predicted small secreted protein
VTPDDAGLASWLNIALFAVIASVALARGFILARGRPFNCRARARWRQASVRSDPGRIAKPRRGYCPMAPTPRRDDGGRVMKTKHTFILVLLAFGFQMLVAAGCANTAKGVQKDYQKAEDKVETVGK